MFLYTQARRKPLRKEIKWLFFFLNFICTALCRMKVSVVFPSNEKAKIFYNME